MWPFKKKTQELEQIKLPFKEPREFVEEASDDRKELILSKLDLIIARLESIDQRLKNLER